MTDSDGVMRPFLNSLIFSGLFGVMTLATAAEPLPLTEPNFEAAAGRLGILLFEVNWGRRWGCAGLDNAQLLNLTFTRLSADSLVRDGTTLQFETPSRLHVSDAYSPYAYLVEPGEYAITGFDVKTARSMTDVGHVLGTLSNLTENDRPTGGTFSVATGEIVYIGHFSLDCAMEPIPWRYYIDGREEFDRWSATFRERFPFVGDAPVQFRLFSTTMFGEPYTLDP